MKKFKIKIFEPKRENSPEKNKEEDLKVNENLYGPDIKNIIKEHDIALGLGNIYHISPSGDLNILLPSTPAEEIRNGKIIWEMDELLSEESKAVCFGTNIEKILAHNPIIKGYLYRPKKIEGLRKFYAEAAEAEEWLDSAIVGEVRAYHPVEVEKVGEFEMIPTKDGLRPQIKWY